MKKNKLYRNIEKTKAWLFLSVDVVYVPYRGRDKTLETERRGGKKFYQFHITYK